MAFSADELRVLRRALAQVLHPPNQALALAPHPAPALLPAVDRRPPTADRRPDRLPDRPPARPPRGTAWVEDVQEVLRLAEAIDEVVDEAGRMRAFALADLARYRHALPGSSAGYLERLRDAVADGYVPDADDLSAMRSLTALPCAPGERTRRLELRSRCGELAEAAVRRRLAPPPSPTAALPASSAPPLALSPAVPSAAVSAPARPLPPRPGIGRVADVRVAGLRAGNVAEFARPGRPQRLREQARPFPIRPGGPTAMDSNDSTPRSADQDSAPRKRVGSAPQDPAEQPRPIPTPGDLWPRGVRREHSEDDELATG
jgi:hypothetical protein